MSSETEPDPIAALIAEIDRITPLIAQLGNSPGLTADDARLALEALVELRNKLVALAEK
jgi:hypothetical protein